MNDRPANPKQAYGDRKRRLDLVPPALAIGASVAYAEGAAKYGAFNWRESHVEAMTYVAAIMRHAYAFMDGEDVDPESLDGKLHLEGIAACVGILLDTFYSGIMIDNRPAKGSAPEKLRDPGKNSCQKPPITETVVSTGPTAREIEGSYHLAQAPGDAPLCGGTACEAFGGCRFPSVCTLAGEQPITDPTDPRFWRLPECEHPPITGLGFTPSCPGVTCQMRNVRAVMDSHARAQLDDLAGLAAREIGDVARAALPDVEPELPTETLVREARVAAGTFDVLMQNPPDESFVRGADTFEAQVSRAAAYDEERRRIAQANIDKMRADAAQATQDKLNHDHAVAARAAARRGEV